MRKISSKTILIPSASGYSIKSIKTARNCGIRTIVMDKNPSAPGFSFADDYIIADISDKQQVLEAAIKFNVDAILPLNDHCLSSTSYVAKKLNFKWQLTEYAANISVNKYLQRVMLPKEFSPKWCLVESFDECISVCKKIGFPVVFKPSYSMGGSRGVIVVENINQVYNAWNYSTSFYPGKPILVEERIDGFEHSAELVVSDGKISIIAISDKVKTPYPYRVDKEVLYPSSISEDIKQKLEDALKNAVKIFNLSNGFFHVEACSLKNGEIKIFELSSRPGGGGTPDPIVTCVTGLNYLELIIRIVLGEKITIPSITVQKHCCYHFFVPPTGKLKKIEGIDIAKNFPEVVELDVFSKIGDIIRPIKIGLDRAGFAIFTAKNRKELIELTEKIDKTVKFIVE